MGVKGPKIKFKILAPVKVMYLNIAVLLFFFPLTPVYSCFLGYSEGEP